MAKRKYCNHPVLNQYLTLYAKSAEISKAQRIFREETYRMVHFDEQKEFVHYTIEGPYAYDNEYEVKIQNYGDINELRTSCTCPLGYDGNCQHIIAAILAFDLKVGHKALKRQSITYNQARTQLFMNSLDPLVIQENMLSRDWNNIQGLKLQDHIKMEYLENEAAWATVTMYGLKNKVRIWKEGKIEWTTSCDCREKKVKVCLHKGMTLIYMLNNYGNQPFRFISNWSDYKNELLAEYGFSLDDDINDKFTFKLGKDLKPELVVLDKRLLKLKDLKKFSKLGQAIEPAKRAIIPPVLNSNYDADDFLKTKPRYTIAYVFRLIAKTEIPGFIIEPAIARLDDKDKPVKKSLNFFNRIENLSKQNLPPIEENDLEIFELIKSISSDNMKNYVKKNLKQRLLYDWEKGGYYINEKRMDKENVQLLYQYIYSCLEPIFKLLKNKTVFFY